MRHCTCVELLVGHAMHGADIMSRYMLMLLMLSEPGMPGTSAECVQLALGGWVHPNMALLIITGKHLLSCSWTIWANMLVPCSMCVIDI